MPAPRRASFTSSSLKGLIMAVTRWAMASPERAVCGGRRLGRRPPGGRATGRDLARSCRRLRSYGDVLLASRQGGDRRTGHTVAGEVGGGRVGHALAELDVVRRSPVLVDVETLELPLAWDAKGPGSPDGLDAVHDEEGDAEHDDHAGQAADGLGPQLRRPPAIEQPLDHGRRVGPVRARDPVTAGGHKPDAE